MKDSRIDTRVEWKMKEYNGNKTVQHRRKGKQERNKNRKMTEQIQGLNGR